MIDLGLAWAFTRFSDDYVARETAARASAIGGIWQAETEPAWEYRARRWTSATAAAPPEGCPIKGNINRKGERIYHTLWSSSYERTSIDEVTAIMSRQEPKAGNSGIAPEAIQKRPEVGLTRLRHLTSSVRSGPSPVAMPWVPIRCR